MDKKASSKSGQTARTSTSGRIRNTFAPDCRNKYFTPVTLHSLCRWGFPFKELPEEAKEMLLEYDIEYEKRCTKTGDKVDIPPLPSSPNIIY